VTRFKGTPKEHLDLIPISLKENKSFFLKGKRWPTIELKLAGGSRTELAAVPEESEYRNITTAAPLTTGVSGLGGGCGTAGTMMSTELTTATPQGVPVVNTVSETRMPGIGSSAADLRVSVKVNPDRKTLRLDVNPVFGTGKDVAMPKVPLLPGGEDR
jgi:hypothetical protein